MCWLEAGFIVNYIRFFERRLFLVHFKFVEPEKKTKSEFSTPK